MLRSSVASEFVALFQLVAKVFEEGKNLENVICIKSGTEGRSRTDTPVKEPDFESGASTSSATPARGLIV